MAFLANQGVFVLIVLNCAFAGRAGQNVQQFFFNGHGIVLLSFDIAVKVATVYGLKAKISR